jgi:regulator of sigma E protease
MSLTFLSQLLPFIAGLAALIIVHELGHFLAARLFKVEVEEFGIGFPPRIVKLFEAGGTVFSLNWIPLGGFVRPKGENDPDVPGGLAAASPWVRLAVLFSGPAMNLLAGVILASLLFYNLGEPMVDKVTV